MPGQQAAIVASAQDWAKAQTHGGSRRSDQSATLHLDSAAGRASESGASLRRQKMADKVAKADPELAKQVAHGEVSLPKAVAQVEAKATKAPAEAQDAPPAPKAKPAKATDAPPAAAPTGQTPCPQHARRQEGHPACTQPPTASTPCAGTSC